MSEEKVHWKTAQKLEKEADKNIATEEDVFGAEQIQNTKKETIPEDMGMYDRKTIADLVKRVNELEGKDSAIDLGKLKNRERIIRVPLWKDEETGEDFIVTGLTEKLERDGSRKTTWERGRDDITEEVITWIQPIMVGLDSGAKVSKELRYKDFSSTLSVIPLVVEKEEKEEVDMTPAVDKGKTVEQVSYEDHGQFIRPKGT